MKVLFSSYAFAPSVGGIESVSALLAREFVRAGHEVRLITETPSSGKDIESFPVIRGPSVLQLLALLRWSDVLFQNNISLRALIPALLLRVPALVVHQTWIRNTRGQIDRTSRIKRALLPRVRNIAISRAMARDLAVVSEIVGNPYDESVFQNHGQARSRRIVFVGRLVSDKGADVLLRACAEVRDLATDLTIIGTGPEETALRGLARELGLNVRFAGGQSGPELARVLNEHQLLAVPSRWAEPFGIVALEGIACGCVVIGAEEGGLPEAMGPCGVTFRNGDVSDLAAKLRIVLTDSGLRERLRQAAPAHLQAFQSKTVAARYLQMLQELAA